MATKKIQILGKMIDTDETLTVSGVAADAKAVGDALAEKQPIGDYALIDDIPDMSEYFPVSGGAIAGDIHMDGYGIYDCEEITGACIKLFSDEEVSLSTESGAEFILNSTATDDGGVVVRGVGAPIDDADAANKSYVDTQRAEIEEQFSSYLPLDGGTMNNADIDGINVLWVNNLIFTTDDDGEIQLYVSNSGDFDENDGAIYDLTFAGYGVRLSGLESPIVDSQAATKAYVDAAIVAALEEIPFAENNTF